MREVQLFEIFLEEEIKTTITIAMVEIGIHGILKMFESWLYINDIIDVDEARDARIRFVNKR
jgi:hypothetical protein